MLSIRQHIFAVIHVPQLVVRPLNQYYQLCSSDSEREYLEVSHHDEASSADPRRREASRVEDAVLMLLEHMGVTHQANQHH